MTIQRSLASALTIALVLAAGCKGNAPASAPPTPEPSAPAAPGTETAKAAPAGTDQPAAAPPAAPSLPAEPAGASDPASGEDGRNARAARVDTDGDGVISDQELATERHDRAERLRKRFDADGDGKLTPLELTKVEGRMRFADPAAVDTNHDGDVSVDEIVEAMKTRGDRRKNRAAQSKSGTPTPGPISR